MFLRQQHRTTFRRIQSLRLGAVPKTRSVSAAYYTLGPRTKTQDNSSRPDAHPSVGPTHGSRTLATAVENASLFETRSMDGLSPTISRLDQPSMQPFYYLRPFDPSQPLIVEELAPTIPRRRTNLSGIPGDAEELVAVFNACLQVGKLQRARLVLKRMSGIPEFPRHDQVVMHNRYLKASLDEMRQTPEGTSEDLHRWYELHIRKPGLPQTAETVACMLKASILSQRGARLSRSILRYMSMAPGEAGLEVLSRVDILSDEDLAIITDICPTYNLVSHEELGTSTDGETADPAVPSASTSAEPPTVLPTPQKGLGLKLIRDTLSLFDEMPQGFDLSSLPANERREIQARLERDCVESAVQRWREEHDHLQKLGLNSVIGHQSLGARMYGWQHALEARIKEELVLADTAEQMKEKRPDDYDRCIYGPFLRQSTPSRVAAVTILGTLNAVAVLGVERGAKLSATVNSIAKLVEEDIRDIDARKKRNLSRAGSRRRAVQHALKKGRERFEVNTEALVTEGVNAEAANTEGKDHIASPPTTESATAAPDKPWPTSIRAKVGAFLLSALIQTAKIQVTRQDPDTKETISQWQRAFHHTKKLKKGKKIGMIFVNDDLVSILKKEPKGNYLAKHLPMVVEPQPWTKFGQGAFLDTSANLVRLKMGDQDQQLYTETAIARGDLDQVLRGLDVLGKTAWRINIPVLNVMLQAWNEGREIASIPALNPDIPYPPEPDTEDHKARGAWYRAVTATNNKKSGFHSQRCFTNLQLEVARAYRNQTFYFPHNIDFRGRAYPLPTYLNHMGADNVRGILRFAKGKELGSGGLQWLKIHTANVFGFSKANLSDRAAFTDANLENIRDSATNPLTGKMWWLEAEDPWQTLAACFELKAALDLPDPTKFVSTLPVHQDGTCNGLQHYAALGGDSWGARQVNLEPGDRPADVYTAVADLVIGLVEEDVKRDNVLAKCVQGKITRKVVKQTVMTNVYGVTFNGAKKQVQKQLEAAYPTLEKDTGIAPLLLATYVSRHIFKAMSTMFRGAHDIQSWLGQVGDRICTSLLPEQLELIARDPKALKKAPVTRTKTKAKQQLGSVFEDIKDQFKSTIVWTTPLRMPVAQPYRRRAVRVVRTCIQDFKLLVPNTADPVNRRKQLQAFPPNFIHSLDASHMILSALQCNDEGLTFAAVHDSFWTHAVDVDIMNRILRDAFVRIHSEDVIGRLAAEFEARYKGSIYLATINKATPIGRKLAAWRKSQSLGRVGELIAEHERQKLLHSSNPADVEKGKQMVTAGSIWEEAASDSALVPDDDTTGLDNAGEEDDEIADDEHLAEKEEDEEEEDEEVEEEEEEEDRKNKKNKKEEEEDWLLRAVRNKSKSVFEVKAAQIGKKKPALPYVLKMQVWLPLTLPPLPKKGDFDVSRLKSSKYFFS